MRPVCRRLLHRHASPFGKWLRSHRCHLVRRSRTALLPRIEPQWLPLGRRAIDGSVRRSAAGSGRRGHCSYCCCGQCKHFAQRHDTSGSRQPPTFYGRGYVRVDLRSTPRRLDRAGTECPEGSNPELISVGAADVNKPARLEGSALLLVARATDAHCDLSAFVGLGPGSRAGLLSGTTARTLQAR